MKLPQNIQAVAEVIGREKALYLVGQLPRTRQVKQDSRVRWRIYLYVPKRLTADCNLVQILGWSDALKMSRMFGGEILQLESCKQLATDFLHLSIRAQHHAGASIQVLSTSFGMTTKSIVRILDTGPEEISAANDNNPVKQTGRLSDARTSGKVG